MIGKGLFVTPEKKTKAKLRLFCFPYAGGSASIYFPWIKKLNNNVELIAIQPPGRGSRMEERPHDFMKDLVNEIMLYADLISQKPYILFGHSLGSRMAFELAINMQLSAKPLPELFIASGSKAPHLPNIRPPIYNLPTADFNNELEKLNGTPKELLSNKELMLFFEPLLRADFKIAETHQSKAIRLPIPIKVLYGQNDSYISVEMLNAWKNLSEFDVEITDIPGGHFFINEQSDLVLQKVNMFINSLQMNPRPNALEAGFI